MKQEIFEKFVEWDIEGVLNIVLAFIMVSIGLVGGRWTEAPLGIMILLIGLWLVVVSIIFDRKVYWRKKE